MNIDLNQMRDDRRIRKARLKARARLPLEKIEDVKCPTRLSWYLVPCIIHHSEKIEGDPFERKLKYTPVYNTPHSDNANGQKEMHYHMDQRFGPSRKRIWKSVYNIRPLHTIHTVIEYLPLQFLRHEERLITPVSMINKANLKHKCIHKGKCPHRGYDLSNTLPDKDGVITCPLHGLKFGAFGKKPLLNDATVELMNRLTKLTKPIAYPKVGQDKEDDVRDYY